MRWVRTIDEAPHMFASGQEADSDWLLYSGGWQVGRVHRPGGGRQDLFSWSLTGPHGPVITMRGDATNLEGAKECLIAALRSWAAWAGVRRDGADEARWVRTSEHRPRIFAPAYEDETDWLLALRRRKLRLKSKAGRTTSTMARRSSSARGARGCDGPNCRCQTHPAVHDPQPHSRRETTPGGGPVAVVSAMTPIAALQRISSEVRDGPHSDSSTSKNLGAWSGVLSWS